MTVDPELLQQLYGNSVRLQAFDLDIVPTPVIPIVTQTDIRNHFITRYFVRYANNAQNIVEVDAQQYSAMKSNPRFKAVTLKWKIVGDPYTKTLSNGAIDKGVEDFNKENVRRADKTFGGLVNVISDYLYLWVSDSFGNTILQRQTDILPPAKRIP